MFLMMSKTSSFSILASFLPTSVGRDVLEVTTASVADDVVVVTVAFLGVARTVPFRGSFVAGKGVTTVEVPTLGFGSDNPALFNKERPFPFVVLDISTIACKIAMS